MGDKKPSDFLQVMLSSPRHAVQCTHACDAVELDFYEVKLGSVCKLGHPKLICLCYSSYTLTNIHTVSCFRCHLRSYTTDSVNRTDITTNAHVGADDWEGVIDEAEGAPAAPKVIYLV